MSAAVRRVRADEWSRVKALRLEAVSDPAAPVAFLRTYAEEAAHHDAFWRSRAQAAAAGVDVAQFIAEAGREWVGTLSVLRRAVDSIDHHGRSVLAPRADVVGVYVRPGSRGAGIIDLLVSEAAHWARGLGDHSLCLDVHVENPRAVAAYRRCGFVDTGRRFTASIGPEMEMVLPLDDRAEPER